jgi:hypothetical protein
MLTIVRAGLRGTALGAVAYPSVDAETTPEGYCTCVRVATGGATALDTQSAASLDTRSRRSAFQAALSKRDDDTIEEPLA